MSADKEETQAEPQAGTSDEKQLPVESCGKAAPLPEVYTPPKISENFLMIWRGNFVFLETESKVQMHLVSGSLSLARSVLQDKRFEESLNIDLRIKIQPTVVSLLRNQFNRRYSMLFAAPLGYCKVELCTQRKCLEDGLMKYLQRSDYAGIVRVPQKENEENRYLISVFTKEKFMNLRFTEISEQVLKSFDGIPFLVVAILPC
ncbi:hypothetical protein CDAR_581361 [Caerostris darwini]|uniref:SPOC domain-containing protein n=1 Tax=Caerostris darwini TaxID=1538125 RepID=A0AAV4VYI8_9ARAC|nr:hypothetical protein CDAR_581361 [Caerostris darwini]